MVDAMTDRTILIDADIVAYKAAVVNEKTFDFGDTGVGEFLDHDSCIRNVDALIGSYADTCKASRVLVCLSEPDGDKNFRKQLNPTYKHNRKDVIPPQLLMWIKEYLENEYKSFRRPRLEADDIMGILATSGDRFIQGDRIIVSEDKDMRTVPSRIYNPNHPDLGIITVSSLDAKRFHMWQTVVGDTTDGYGGCPGIGKGGRYVEYAESILEADTPDELWDLVLMAYASKGLTEDDAILQARMARILQDGDYNYRTKGIRLWNPTCLYW
jgi:DNA polymerase-1